MNLLDKIRKESESPSVIAETTTDLLTKEIQINDDNQPENSESETTKIDSWEQELLAELNSLPSIAEKKIGIRLEEQTLIPLQAHCKAEGITIETFVEATFMFCQQRPELLKEITSEASIHLMRRKKAGTIRSVLTKTRNLKGKQ